MLPAEGGCDIGEESPNTRQFFLPQAAAKLSVRRNTLEGGPAVALASYGGCSVSQPPAVGEIGRQVAGNTRRMQM
ncbi:hypothetical protein CL631_00020 [bacterium]|jgi:hypothetical protein|nr:hypothetical protein [bacterium]|tara:strand:- start:4778 stop:5002 length:225 start_codon:yes stop_codon:yes gene_type:complete